MRHACQDSNFTIMTDAYFFSLSHIFSKQISLGVECYIGINDKLGSTSMYKMCSLLLALFVSFERILNQSGLLLYLEI